nr:endonuclease [Robertkochia sp. 3YJGBD-33]
MLAFVTLAWASCRHEPRQGATLTYELNPPEELQDYYKDLDLRSIGESFYDELAVLTIAKHRNILPYNDRHRYLYKLDRALTPGQENKVILLYTGELADNRAYLSEKNSFQPQLFNTEHVYPQSLITNTAKGDLHHLRVCEIAINSLRGNKKYVQGKGSWQNHAKGFYPGDEWKGDVARMIFYLNLRYNENFSEVGSLDLFLKWNTEDPVSAFEIRRNNEIEQIQGNRNPFIDNPVFSTLIWQGPAAANRWEDAKTQ